MQLNPGYDAAVAGPRIRYGRLIVIINIFDKIDFLDRVILIVITANVVVIAIKEFFKSHGICRFGKINRVFRQSIVISGLDQHIVTVADPRAGNGRIAVRLHKAERGAVLGQHTERAGPISALSGRSG